MSLIPTFVHLLSFDPLLDGIVVFRLYVSCQDIDLDVVSQILSLYDDP